jgi:hypothetical protein
VLIDSLIFAPEPYNATVAPASRRRPTRRGNYELEIGGHLHGRFGCLLALVALSFLIRQTLQDVYLSLVLLVLGLTIGWVLGTLSAPYTKKEETQFAAYAKAASLFVSAI